MIPHITNECPVSPDTLVVVHLADTSVADDLVDRAEAFNWGAGLGPNGEGRIESYCVVAPRRGTDTAAALLNQAAAILSLRAVEYDKPQGERSMGATVLAFNALTGRDLKESEGWLLMELLKAARDFGSAEGHEDSQLDRINYAALGAEARRAGR
jgi:hypothetical protein